MLPQHRRSSSISQGGSFYILDIENMNPVVIKKRAETGYSNSSPLDLVASSSTVGPLGHAFRAQKPAQNMIPSTLSNEHYTTNGYVMTPALLLGPDKVARKRTLSDFMDEELLDNIKDKAEEREREDWRDGFHSNRPRLSPPVHDPMRHHPWLVASNSTRLHSERPSNNCPTPLKPRNSSLRPPRAKNDENKPKASGSRSFKQPSPRLAFQTVFPPPVGGKQEVRNKYVIPEWARTTTSTVPRLSEQLQRALEDATERKEHQRKARTQMAVIRARQKRENLKSTLKAEQNAVEQQPVSKVSCANEV